MTLRNSALHPETTLPRHCCVRRVKEGRPLVLIANALTSTFASLEDKQRPNIALRYTSQHRAQAQARCL